MQPDIITSIPLFASISRRRHRELARLADEVDIPEGYELTRQGDLAREFFVVVTGTADVYRDGRRVATLGPGDFFGEVGMLAARWERTATVVASSPMRLLVVARREFQELLHGLPSVAAPILRAATARASARQRQATAGAGSLPSSST